MNCKHASMIAAIPIAIALAGCGSTNESTAQPVASSVASDVAGANAALASASAIAAAASASAAAASAAAPCTTNSCIVSTLDQSLTGQIDQAEAVATKVKCSSSSVKDEGNGTYTTWCTVHYSDGTSDEGYGTLDTSLGKVTFEPAS